MRTARVHLSSGERFLRFVAASGTAALVNLGSRWWLSGIMSFEAAVVIAYLIGMTTAFVLARAFVFEPTDPAVSSQYARFAIVNLVALAQVFGVSWLLARVVFPTVGFTWQPELVAHAIGIASPIFTSYWGHRHYSFR